MCAARHRNIHTARTQLALLQLGRPEIGTKSASIRLNASSAAYRSVETQLFDSGKGARCRGWAATPHLNCGLLAVLGLWAERLRPELQPRPQLALAVPERPPYPPLRVQLWDKDVLTPDYMIGDATLGLDTWFRRTFKKRRKEAQAARDAETAAKSI